MFLGVLGVILACVLYKVIDYVLRIPKQTKPTKRTRYILVTGCDSGFGNLFAKRLDAKGFTVIAACLTDQGKDELHSSCENVRVIKMDVSSEESVHSAFRLVKNMIGDESGLWAVVNNAGIVGATGVGEWLHNQDYRAVIDINLFGIISVVRTFLPLIKRNKGRIVNTASIVGRLAVPGSGPYVVSKYAVEAYTDILRRELKSFGVSVHTVEPGFFKTRLTQPDFVESSTKAVWDRLSPSTREEYGQQYYEQSVEITRKTLPFITSGNLHCVVSAYEHAVLSYFPRTRYMPGWDARLFYWPLTLAPEWLSDLILTGALPTPASMK